MTRITSVTKYKLYCNYLYSTKELVHRIKRITYNHIINLAELLSFQHVDEKIHEKFLEFFKDNHFPASAIYLYENELYLSIMDKQKLLVSLADQAINPDYNYIVKLFQKYQEIELDDCNDSSIFRCLANIVNDYNNLDQGKAVLQEYNLHIGKAFILYMITSLMSHVYEKILQSDEICYIYNYDRMNADSWSQFDQASDKYTNFISLLAQLQKS